MAMLLDIVYSNYQDYKKDIKKLLILVEQGRNLKNWFTKRKMGRNLTNALLNRGLLNFKIVYGNAMRNQKKLLYIFCPPCYHKQRNTHIAGSLTCL